MTKTISLTIGMHTDTFTISEYRGDSASLVYMPHGNWYGIYDEEMCALTPLQDSCGWITEEQRKMKTIFGVKKSQ